jgi:1,6-anhydro-N-acetylmuramate kinase
MLDIRLLDRLHALQQRRRWMVGLRLTNDYRHLRAALVGTEGHALAVKAEVFTHVRSALPPHLRRVLARVRGKARARQAGLSLVAAQLAECQAALLDELAGEVAPIWDRVLAVAVDDPGLWSKSLGLRGWLGLCDAARLAELSGQNVVEGFAARDLALEGRGRPLWPIVDWLLLHDLQKNRLLVERGRGMRCTFLPASRDTTGAAHTLSFHLPTQPALAGCDSLLAEVPLLAARLRQELPADARIDQVVWAGQESAAAVHERLTAELGAKPVTLEQLGFPRGALRPAGVALLGLLHLDQTPANLPAITGARTSRVLGRLTPGSLPAWHRLLRELSAARPSVMPLRSAV